MLRLLCSKTCLMGLTLYHLMHGMFTLVQPLQFIELSAEKKALGYIGDELSLEMVLRSLQVAGVSEVVLGLAVFMFSDTKLCLATLVAMNMVLLSTSYRVMEAGFNLEELSQGHHVGLLIMLKVTAGVLVVSFLGLVTSGGTHMKSTPRSSSSVAAFILLLNVVVEGVFHFVSLLNPKLLNETASPDFSKNKLTSVGSLVFEITSINMDAKFIGLCFLCHTLKPTHVALMLFAALHFGVAAVEYLSYEKVMAIDAKDSAFHIFMKESAMGAGVVHAGFGLLSVIGVIFAMMATAKAKPVGSKKKKTL